MSNIIPPLLSNTPPPPPSPEEEEDDEFGDFIGTNNLSFGCDNLSLPTSPEHSPDKVSIPKDLDINENAEFDKIIIQTSNLKLNAKKDFQDKRKDEEESCIDSVPQLFDNCYETLENECDRSLSSKDQIEFGELQGNDSLTNSFDNFEHSTSISNILIERKNVDQDQEETANIDKPHNLVVDKQLNCDNSFENVVKKSQDNLVVYKQSDGILTNSEEPLGVELLQSSAIIDSCDTNDENSTQDEFIECLTTEASNEKLDEIINNSETSFGKQDLFHIKSNVIDDNRLSLDAAETFYDQNDQSLKLGTIEDTFTNRHEFEFNLSTNISATSVEEHVLPSFPTQSFTNDNDDDFGDFADFSDFNSCQITDISNNIFDPTNNLDRTNVARGTNDDDFGEFKSSTYETDTSDPFESAFTSGSSLDTTLGVQEPPLQLITPKQALDQAKVLFEELFPVPQIKVEEVTCEEIQKNNSIFELLKDITDTPALSYQWPKSSSQQLLLKALNIDERNILPPWSSSMPLYACNLGVQPLEPTKTEHQTTTIQLSPTVQPKAVTEEIPSAQFDWKGAGLENPLTATSQQSTKEILNLDLPQKSETTPETPAIQPDLSSRNEIHKTPTIDENIDDYGEFSGHRTDLPQQCNTWTNLTPLRETYISNDNIVEVEDNLKKPSGDEMWLSSTSYTSPVSPWTDNESSNKDKNLIIENKGDIEDDFDDFQAATLDSHDQIKTEIVKSPDNISNCDTYESADSKSVIKEIPVELIAAKTYEINVKELNEVPIEDDEFTDFHSSIPVFQEKPTNSIQEPLQPVPVYQHSASSSTQINWPDPGITDEEIMKFEEVFCKPSQTKKENLDTKIVKDDSFNVLPKNEFGTIVQHQDHLITATTSAKKDTKNKILDQSKKELKLDDLDIFAKPLTIKKDLDLKGSEEIRHKSKHSKKKEEIGDHHIASKSVYSSKLEPSRSMQNTKTNTKKQSSFEEDDWSDFVSAQKVSPVHKLSTREMERTSSPDLPLSVFNLNSIQPAKQPIPVITPQGLVQTKLSANMSNTSPKTQVKINRSLAQPSLSLPSTISSQYASQAYNFNSKLSKKMTSPESNISHDDDEWGEFVSSPLPSQSTANGYRDQQSWQNPLQQMGWTNYTPNIITNPGHCVQSAGDVGKRVSNVNTTKKQMIPNLVLPDLDFVAPKNRTSISRKK